MKKLFPIFIITSLVSLSSCGLFSAPASEEKLLEVYDLDNKSLQGENTQNLSGAKSGEVKARFIQGKELIPYVSLKQYADFYKPHFAKNVESVVESTAFYTSWLITIDDQPCFQAIINYLSKSVMKGGDIQNAFDEEKDARDLKALNYGMQLDVDGKFLEDKGYELYDYSDYNFQFFTSGGEKYFPLGFLDTTFSASSGIYFEYNYKHIYETCDAENYSLVSFKEDDKEYTFDSQMEEAASTYGTIPSYLAKYNADLFVYLMDNFYGLKNYNKISSMASYLKSINCFADLYNSNNAEQRGLAYSNALFSFDDNHTGLVSVNNSWGEKGYRGQPGKGVINRSLETQTLKQMRKSYYDYLGKVENKDIIYSNDGKTAMFMFDSFSFGTSKDVFNEDDSIKETAYLTDTYFSLIKVFDEIKAHGGVENVILDISTNGGGTVGIMAKLLALISKNNEGHLYFYQANSTQLAWYNAMVDVDNDKEYEEDETYGNDFSFYILTSNCSFSCANAFPCLAQKQGLAKIIGEKSGGGECAVNIHYLPNSQYVYHSSDMHLGFYDEETNVFTGFEGGAIPDYEIAISESFYDINFLSQTISQ